MIVIHRKSGKIGNTVVGPKHFAGQDVLPGQIALCINTDSIHANWIIGSIYELKTYLSLDDIVKDIGVETVTALNNIINNIARSIPVEPIDRLASVLSIEPNKLREAAKLSRICISNV